MDWVFRQLRQPTTRKTFQQSQASLPGESFTKAPSENFTSFKLASITQLFKTVFPFCFLDREVYLKSLTLISLP